MVARVESEIIGSKRGQQRVGQDYCPVGDSRTLVFVLKTGKLKKH